MKSKWENPKCNFCGSSEYEVVYDNFIEWAYEGKFGIVKCKNCDLCFTSPRPIPSEIGKYYEASSYYGREMTHKEQTEKNIKERDAAFSTLYELIAQFKKTGRILDIGAGIGMMLSKYKDDGWDAQGIEISPEAVKFAKIQYKLRLRQGDFFDFSFQKNSFDVIVLNNALEHLYNPQETIDRVYALLKDGGLIVVAVPNCESLGRKIFEKKWLGWQPPRHLYHFSAKTLANMFIHAGFKNLHVAYNYTTQNKYSLFQSLRYAYSPKFQKKSGGGLMKTDTSIKNGKINMNVELGKIAGNVFASIGAFIEPALCLGEIIIVYVQK
ncbi:MAG TPA: class I SAM-dependent methyltransferase [Patescibacteria group bacterium]|nr:class I SAM-dependent methyltransferase [Patescibacteria group bacterium]